MGGKKNGRQRQAADDNMAHAGYLRLQTHTFGMCNTYGFSTATVVVRKRHNIQLQRRLPILLKTLCFSRPWFLDIPHHCLFCTSLSVVYAYWEKLVRHGSRGELRTLCCYRHLFQTLQPTLHCRHANYLRLLPTVAIYVL